MNIFHSKERQIKMKNVQGVWLYFPEAKHLRFCVS